MMRRAGRSWSGKEVRVAIISAVGGLPLASRRLKMSGYAANDSASL